MSYARTAQTLYKRLWGEFRDVLPGRRWPMKQVVSSGDYPVLVAVNSEKWRVSYRFKPQNIDDECYFMVGLARGVSWNMARHRHPHALQLRILRFLLVEYRLRLPKEPLVIDYTDRPSGFVAADYLEDIGDPEWADVFRTYFDKKEMT